MFFNSTILLINSKYILYYYTNLYQCTVVYSVCCGPSSPPLVNSDFLLFSSSLLSFTLPDYLYFSAISLFLMSTTIEHASAFIEGAPPGEVCYSPSNDARASDRSAPHPSSLYLWCTIELTLNYSSPMSSPVFHPALLSSFKTIISDRRPIPR